MYAIASAVLLAQSGLTFSEVVSDIPRDPAAIVVYVMLAVSVWLIWRGGRGKPRSSQ